MGKELPQWVLQFNMSHIMWLLCGRFQRKGETTKTVYPLDVETKSQHDGHGDKY